MAIAFANGQSNSADVSTTTVVSSYNAGSGNKIIAAIAEIKAQIGGFGIWRMSRHGYFVR